MKNLFFIAEVLAAVAGHAALGQQPQGHVSAESISLAEQRFGTNLGTGGMQAVTTDIQRCYDATWDTKPAVAKQAVITCILYDLSAYDFDQGMRKVMISRGSNDPGPVNSYFADTAFETRMSIYVPVAFGNVSSQQVFDYYGDAPGIVDGYAADAAEKLMH